MLAFNGHVNWYAEGYFTKFEVKRVSPNSQRPHGLSYSLTLHAPDGTRLVGFDNAHVVAPVGSRFRPRSIAADHWHRTDDDAERPYHFVNAEGLILALFAEVERVLKARGVPFDVVATDQEDQRSKP